MIKLFQGFFSTIWKYTSFQTWFANLVSWGGLYVVGREILPDADEKTQSYVGLTWVSGIITGIALYVALMKLLAWAKK